MTEALRETIEQAWEARDRIDTSTGALTAAPSRHG